MERMSTYLPRWLRRRPKGAPEECFAPKPAPAGRFVQVGAELGIELERSAERARLVLTGELDLSNADAFAAQVSEAESADPEVIEIDLRGLTFLDSSGLRELFAAHRRARARNRRIVLIKDAGGIDRVLNVARVEDVIDVVDHGG